MTSFKKLKSSNLNLALKITNSIPNIADKSYALHDIFKEVLKVSNIDRAVHIANSFPSNEVKKYSLNDIHNYSAINIQKIVRGYQVRIKQDPSLDT